MVAVRIELEVIVVPLVVPFAGSGAARALTLLPRNGTVHIAHIIRDLNHQVAERDGDTMKQARGPSPEPANTKPWLREPLVWFVAIAIALLGIEALRAPAAHTARIEVSAEVMEALQRDHVARTGHQPDGEEVSALLAQHLRDEVLYREALALGLDGGDPVVRRRMIQQMAFLIEDRTPIAEPSDAELTAHLAQHADRYRVPEQLTLEHVFVGGHSPPEMVRWLEALRAGGDPGAFGDAFVLGQHLPHVDVAWLDERFGNDFGQSLSGVPEGTWVGPVASSFGRHLVRVTDRLPAHLPSLEAVRVRVVRDWMAEARAVANREAIEALLAEYEVEVAPASLEAGWVSVTQNGAQ
jgi:hypothetical protein